MEILETIRSLGVEIFDFANDTLTITLKKPATTDDVDVIKNALFLDIEIVNIDSLISVSENVVKAFCRNYNKFQKIISVLRGFEGINIQRATIEPFSLSIEYIPVGRCTLDYDELELVQAVIDPTIGMHNSIRVTGSNDNETHEKIYTLRANLH